VKGWLVGFMVIALSLAASDARATDARTLSEYRRLSEQIVAYAERTAWPAAARSFAELEALPGAPLTPSDLFIGAQAARALGDAMTCRGRLLRAFSIQTRAADFDPRAAQWLGELQTEYGHVTIRLKGSTASLKAANPPFQPDRMAAIQFADARLQAERSFDGLLPAGEYTIGAHTLTVVAGTDAEVYRFKIKAAKP
jgi:hypothetical protein